MHDRHLNAKVDRAGSRLHKRPTSPDVPAMDGQEDDLQVVLMYQFRYSGVIHNYYKVLCTNSYDFNIRRPLFFTADTCSWMSRIILRGVKRKTSIKSVDGGKWVSGKATTN
jgi:hypothetical protein